MAVHLTFASARWLSPTGFLNRLASAMGGHFTPQPHRGSRIGPWLSEILDRWGADLD